MRHTLFSTLLLFLCFTITPAMAETQSLYSLMQEAIEDYNFQDNEDAEKKFLQVIKLSPENMIAHYYLGTLLMIKDNVTEAIPYFERVYHANTNIEGVDSSLAKAYIILEQPEKALPIYKKIYEANSNNDGHAFQYAKVLQNSLQTKQAKIIYTDLINHKSAYTDACRYQLGLLHYNSGLFVIANDYFKAINISSAYGKEGKQYMNIIAPKIELFSAYISAQYFYNDNPSGSSNVAKDLNTVSNTPQSGQGWTIIGTLNSKRFNVSENIQFKVGYLYYGILYTTDGLRSNDFIGHFLNPSLTYHSSPTLDFELKGDYQHFNYSHQLLSKNYGLTLTAHKKLEENANTINMSIAYLKKIYATAFNQTTSLQYLDGNYYTIEFSSNMKFDAIDNLTMNYKFTDNQTTNDFNQARDARSQEHNISANAVIPFSEKVFGKYLSKFRLTPSVSYTQKNYLNPQSIDTTYDRDADPLTADLLIGEKVHAKTTTVGIQLSTTLWQDMGLTLVTGYEHASSSSNAASLTTQYNKYFGGLSAKF